MSESSSSGQGSSGAEMEDDRASAQQVGTPVRPIFGPDLSTSRTEVLLERLTNSIQ